MMLSSALVPALADDVLTGQAAFNDYKQQAPGVKRKITAKDLPKPFATPSAIMDPGLCNDLKKHGPSVCPDLKSTYTQVI